MVSFFFSLDVEETAIGVRKKRNGAPLEVEWQLPTVDRTCDCERERLEIIATFGPR